MASSIMDKWKQGEFTLAVHRGGNSREDLERVVSVSKSMDVGNVRFGVEGDLKWLDDNGHLIFYFYHGSGSGEHFVRDGNELAEMERNGKILTIDEAFSLSEGIDYNLDLKSGGSDYRRAIEKLSEVLEHNGKRDNTWVSAFDLDLLKTIKEINPDLPKMFISFLSVNPSLYLHQPSFRNPFSWGFKDVNNMEGVDIISTWPKGPMTIGDYRPNLFSTIMLGQRVYDKTKSLCSSRERMVSQELDALQESGVFIFPGDFNRPEGARFYLDMKRKGNIGIAGVYINIPENLDLDGIVREIIS